MPSADDELEIRTLSWTAVAAIALVAGVALARLVRRAR